MLRISSGLVYNYPTLGWFIPSMKINDTNILHKVKNIFKYTNDINNEHNTAFGQWSEVS